MKTERVQIREVHIATVEVEVPDNATEDEIKAAAAASHENLVGDYIEYSHTLDRDTWVVE